MTGGSLTTTTGPLLFVTNTTAIIKLSGVKLTSADNKLLDAAADRWGRSGSNGGNVFLTAENQTLVGDVTADKLSSITMTLQKKSTLTGSINRAALTMDSTGKWIVTGDSVLTGLTIEGATSKQITGIEGNGHTVRYDLALPANQWLEGKTLDLPKGGQLVPDRRGGPDTEPGLERQETPGPKRPAGGALGPNQGPGAVGPELGAGGPTPGVEPGNAPKDFLTLRRAALGREDLADLQNPDSSCRSSCKTS
ncbi:MAG: hypothetical protein ABSH20_10825, partial [Tepidisphaeraceae bacterium]|jgi:hypothetical protein